MTMHIRRAGPGDADAVHALLRALADYEKLQDSFHVTPARLEAVLFCEHPHVFCDLITWAGAIGAGAIGAGAIGAGATGDGEPAGLALWHYTFPSFSGRRGLWLEDLFVTPECRGNGLGLALLAHLACLCRDEDLVSMTWNVLPWNAPSIRFYEQLGARRNAQWCSYALTGDALAALAAPAAANI